MSKVKANPHPLDDILSTTVAPKAAKNRASSKVPPRRASARRTSPRRASARRTSPELVAPETSEAPIALESWEATHERVTFHCPIVLRDLIYNEVTDRRKGLSPRERRAFGRTRVIVEILARHYGVKL
jgi:hypothetical protein